MWHRKRNLEQQLRANRPEPPADFFRLAVGKVQAERAVRSRNRGWALQPLVTLIAGAAVVVAFAALGGFSGLKSSVKQSPHLSPFVAAALNYCTQTVSVSLAAGQEDPTTASTINFTVNFHEAVTGFTSPPDIQFGGTAGGTLSALITGGAGGVYNVAVSGMTTAGTVTVTVVGHAAVANEGGIDCDTQASNTQSVTYSKLAITAYDEDGNSGNGSLSGVGAATTGNITITVCKVNSFPCTGPNTAATYVVAPSGTGTFATGENKLAKSTTFWAQAAQGSVRSQPFQFANI